MKPKSFGVAVLLSALTAFPASAHHSGAMFDLQKSVTVDGTVKEFQWTNPHSWLQVMILDGSGQAQEWSLELGPLVGLERAGWKKKSLEPGDKVKVAIHPMRDGSAGGRLISVTFADGHVLNGQGGPGGPPAPVAN
jgi:prepilin-type processing-associated H-X9-DG protein